MVNGLIDRVYVKAEKPRSGPYYFKGRLAVFTHNLRGGKPSTWTSMNCQRGDLMANSYSLGYFELAFHCQLVNFVELHYASVAKAQRRRYL